MSLRGSTLPERKPTTGIMAIIISPAGEDETGKFGGVAKQCLDELRNEDGGAVQREAKHEHQDKADGEVAALEQGEANNGAMACTKQPQLPPDHGDEGHDHGDGEEGDDG